MLQITYIVSFVLCLAIAAGAILLCYQLNKDYRDEFLRWQLYFIISFYAFALYSIWGKILFIEVLTAFEIPEKDKTNLAGTITLIGMPFLLVSWIMLQKMGFAIVRSKIKRFQMVIFSTFVILLLTYCIYLASSEHSFLHSFIEKDSTFWEIAFLAILEFVFYLAFFANVAVHLPSISSDKIRINLSMYMFLLVSGFLIRWSLLIFLYDEAWFLPMAILVFFISNLMPVLLVRKYRDVLFEHVHAENNRVDFSAFCNRHGISKRETEIIELICRGQTNQQIADSLFISLQTVKDHTHRIYTKIGIRSRMQLVQLVNQ